jgi:hypothetical protein
MLFANGLVVELDELDELDELGELDPLVASASDNVY